MNLNKVPDLKTLADLKIGQSAIIHGFTDQELSIKLCEMGCLPGCKITLSNKAPFNGPICIEVSGYNLSMRKEDAQEVTLKN